MVLEFFSGPEDHVASRAVNLCGTVFGRLVHGVVLFPVLIKIWFEEFRTRRHVKQARQSQAAINVPDVPCNYMPTLVMILWVFPGLGFVQGRSLCGAKLWYFGADVATGRRGQAHKAAAAGQRPDGQGLVG